MATNPMQRKARNSILLGIIIGLLLGGLVIAFLFMQLTKVNQELAKTKKTTGTIYILNRSVKSGEKIDSSMLEKVEAPETVKPDNYVKEDGLSEETVAKVDLPQGTILTSGLIQKSTEKVTNDLREQEYNMIELPQQLEIGDYIDVRLRLANGQDYIVISKKEIKNMTADTIWMNLYEEETLIMSNAIVEVYKMPGSKLYATTYVEPGNQSEILPTYTESKEVHDLLRANPNLREEAITAINARNAEALAERRNSDINQALNQNADTASENVQTKVEEEITKEREARQSYIESLGLTE